MCADSANHDAEIPDTHIAYDVQTNRFLLLTGRNYSEGCTVDIGYGRSPLPLIHKSMCFICP